MSVEIDLAKINDKFVKAEQYVHNVIANKSKLTKSVYRGMIPTGKFEYGRGYFMKKWDFYGGKALTDAAADWYQLQEPNDANANGYTDQDRSPDSCQYDPQIVGYGFESKEYTLYETTRRTDDVCLRDLVFKWKFKEQMRLILENLADITLGEWEKWLRETYVTFAAKRIVTEGYLPEFTVSAGVNANGVVTNAGLRVLKLNGTQPEEIGRLTQDVLDRQYPYLARQAMSGATSSGKNGMPVFTLITSFETSTEVITRDEAKNTEMRYARPSFLLEGYGTVEGYKNFAHYHDLETPRYVVGVATAAEAALDAGLSAGDEILRRVYPFEFTTATIGNAVNIARDYVEAPFEISIIFLKNVFKCLIPENPTNVAGATFGGASNMGMFKWINIPDRATNLLGEIGFMFARFNCAPEPMEQVDNALVLLHARPQDTPIVVPTQSAEQTGAGAGPIAVNSYTQPVDTYGDVLVYDTDGDPADANYSIVEISTAPNILATQINDVVLVKWNSGGTSEHARIVNDWTSGRLRIQMVTDATGDTISNGDWVDTFVANGDVTIETV